MCPITWFHMRFPFVTRLRRARRPAGPLFRRRFLAGRGRPRLRNWRSISRGKVTPALSGSTANPPTAHLPSTKPCQEGAPRAKCCAAAVPMPGVVGTTFPSTQSFSRTICVECPHQTKYMCRCAQFGHRQQVATADRNRVKGRSRVSEGGLILFAGLGRRGGQTLFARAGAPPGGGRHVRDMRNYLQMCGKRGLIPLSRSGNSVETHP